MTYGIHPAQLRRYVVQPILEQMGMHSQAAENLIMGTAMQESLCGRYIVQMGGGPALGMWQMEPATHDDIWINWLRYHPERQATTLRISGLSTRPHARHVVMHTGYACAMARLQYYRRPEALPDYDDWWGLAEYYKDHYNTRLGKATTREFVQNYERMLLIEGNED